MVTMQGDVAGAHWAVLQSLLPTYRSLTTVSVGDGRSTSFWDDVWLPAGALADAYPVLHSHCSAKNASVRQVLHEGLGAQLVPRLNQEAQDELAEVMLLIEGIALFSDPDNRQSPFLDSNGALCSAPIYKAMMTDSGTSCAFAKFVWHNHAPPRARFFAWLLVQERIQCKATLLRKHIVLDAVCDVCHAGDETPQHLILGCSFSCSFWSAIGVTIPPTTTVANLWALPRPSQLPAPHFDCYILLCCWQLWKHRHDVVFRSLHPSLPRLLIQCKEAAVLWRCRLPLEDRDVVNSWCTSFSTPM